MTCLRKCAIIAQVNATDQQAMADLLKALGEFNRLSLVYELCDCAKPRNAMCLCGCCSVDSSVASRAHPMPDH